MKKLLLLIVTIVTLITFPKVMFGQINLGAASNFALYTSGGAVHDNPSSNSLITGDVGYYTSGSFLGFGNVNGVMRPGVTTQTTAAELALQSVVAQINSTTNDYFPGLLLGNGVVYGPGVYSIPGNATMSLNMTLDAQNNPNAQFIIKITGTFATTAASEIILVNGAQACNVYWLVQGQINIATNSKLRGTFIANNAAINFATGGLLEGRLLSTTGAITIDGVNIFTPQGCGSPVLTGPAFPNMGEIECYSIFSSNGALTNTIGTTNAVGDVGNNGIGAITGWDPSAVTGTLHLLQDASTIQAASDLSVLYNTLNAMVPDIELLYPAKFGNNLVLTPHVYVMNSAATFKDSLTLDAQGNPDGVFVIKITGGSPALSTSTYSKVKLINGAQAKNVFWVVYGAVNINNFSEFKGTIVVPNGAISLVNTGLDIEGRALTMVGSITTAGLDIQMPPGCFACITTFTDNPQEICFGDSYAFNGNVYTVAGNYVDTLITSLGCDSIITTILTVNPTYSIDNLQSICDGDSYLINGNTYTVAGNYVDTLITSLGCDSIINTILTVNPTYLINNLQTICDGDSYMFNGNTYTVAGTYNDTLISINGCDSIIATNLTVNPSFEFITNQEICDGESFLWRGVNYNTTNTYYDSLLTVNNCDSVYVLNLIVNPVSITNNPQTICYGDSYLINGNTYITPGTYNDTLVSINGCDSIVITQLTVNPVYTTNNPQAICEGDSYIINGNTYTTAGIYNDTLTTVNGCDSIIVTVLTIESAPVIITPPINQTVCNGDSVSFIVVATGANLTYQWRRGLIPLVDGGNISGVNTDTLTINPAGIFNIGNNYNVVVSGGCVAIDTITVGLVSAGGFGILAGTGISSTGFTEIHNMDVGLYPGVRSSIVGFPPAIVVNGFIYASDDIAPPGVAAMLIQAKQDLTDAYLYAEGATAPAPITVAGDQGGLTLTPGIYKSTSTLLIQSGDLTLDAQGDVNAKWIFQIASDFTTIGGAGGNVILTGGAQADNITWQVGSSATIGNSTSFSGNILALTSITMNTGSSIDGRLLARNGAVVLSGTNILNAPSDSVGVVVSQEISVYVSLDVNPIPVITSAASGSVCSGQAQNYIITSDVIGTTYYWSRAAVVGISNMTVFNQTNNPITEVLINTTQLPVVVTYLITPTADSCVGNTFTYNVTVSPISTTINPQAICDGGSYAFNGNIYTVAGNYNDTLIGVNGCDSIVITQLTVYPTYLVNNPQTICDGDSYSFNGNVYTIAGNYINTFTSVNGCDSIVVVQLTVNPVITTINPQTICDGDSYTFNGNIYTIAGTYNDTIIGITGCDSIIVTQLSVNPVYNVNNPQTICEGESYLINGNFYTLAGNYIDTLFTVFGCDSIITTQLTVTALPIANASSNSPVCEGDAINLFAQNVTAANYEWVGPNNFSSSNQNPIILTSVLADAGNYSLVVELNGCFSIPSIVNVIVNDCNSDLEVVKTANNMNPLIGKTVIFTIVAKNNGPYDATNVIVSDILSSGFVYVSSTTTTGTYDASTGDWVIGNMYIDATEVLTITATVASSGSWVNTAIISGDENDYNLGNNVSTIELMPVEFFIPEAFSPNGDLINDNFVIIGIEYYPNNTIIIFNRWGDKVFEANPYQNTWNGTSMFGLKIGGNELPVGTYFYLLDLGDDTEVIKGTIYINR